MNLGFNEEQKLIKSSAEKYFLENYSFDKRKRYLSGDLKNTDKWKDFSSLGWLGLPFSEKYGGYSGKVSDVMVLMETFGRALVIEPYVYFNILSGLIIEKMSLNENKSELLFQIINGSRKVSFAFAEPQSRFSISNIKTEAIRDNVDWIINGKKNFVVETEISDHLLIPAYCSQDEEVKLFLIDKNNTKLNIISYKNIDSSSVADIILNNLKIKNQDLIGSFKKGNYEREIEYFIDYATLANCSQALGIVDKMYELTLEYVKTREQFGKKIGEFQVVQHRMVEIFIKKEEMRSLNYMAQVNMYKDDVERKKNISLNKIFLGTHAKLIGQECIQLHGGMGVAEEMQIGHYFKRLTTLNTIFGNIDYHYDRYSNNCN